MALLKLKAKEFIPSEDDHPPPSSHKKKFKTKLMMETYIDHIQRKTLGKQDVKLLEVLGFEKCLEIVGQ